MKRCKTNESVSPKRSTNSTLVRADKGILNTVESSEAQQERISAHPERSPAQPCRNEKEAAVEVPFTGQPTKPTKKPTRARQNLCLDSEAKKHEDLGNGATQTGGLEDTFIFGLKSKQQRPKRTPQVVHASESLECAEKQLPPKVKRTTKSSGQTDKKPIPQPIEDLPVRLGVVQEEPRASKKKPAAKRRIATAIAESDQPKETPEVNFTCDKSRKPTTTAVMTNDPTKENTDLKPESVKTQPVKAKEATRKANKRTLNEALGNVDDVSAAAPEKASKRPRRQAAISAIEKVTLSYKEDLVSVDKLRRAPELEVKPRKSRNAAVLEDVLEMKPSSAVLSVPNLHENCNNDEEEIAASEPQPKKRSRKKAVEIPELNEDKFAESADAIGHQTADQDSSARGKRHVTEVELSHLKPPTAQRGRKPGAKAAKAITAPAIVVPAVEDLASVEDNNSQNTPIEPEKHHEDNHKPEDMHLCTTIPESKRLKETSKSAEQHPKEAGKKSTAKPPTNTRRALADFDSNIVRRPSVSESKKLDQSASPPAKQQKKQPEVKTQPQPQAKPRGRPRKAQPDQQSDISPNNDPPLSTSKAPKKRHKISANEDLDWLFEDHSTRGACPAAAAAVAGGGSHLRQPKPKTVPRRKETAVSSAKEMDLDDLLESIAGFSGKLLTGQRARGVVTK